MDNATCSNSTGTSSRRLSRPWGATPVVEMRRPSAYAHYKKLVRDFDDLEDDLEKSRIAQEQLQAQLQRHSHAVDAHSKQQRAHELAAWEREREQRVEEICVHHDSVQALHREQQALSEAEVRLLAQLEVFQERQQQENETEAKKLSELVHGRTSLLDDELVKARADVDFLTQIVTTAKRRQVSSDGDGGDERRADALHSLVGAIQSRRQDAFQDATARFHERIRSFELERETLRRQTDEIQRTKQRALQVLSTNQQRALSEFFTTPSHTLAASQDPNLLLSSLEFRAIVETMEQPSGAVSRLQDVEHGKATSRLIMDEALAEAARNLEHGPNKLEALEESIQVRQQDAIQLHLMSASLPGHGGKAYDGAWGIETYRREQYGLMYFLRSMVFEWMESAVGIVQHQPETQLLELEIRRHGATRIELDASAERQRMLDCALRIAQEIEQQVVLEIAKSIHDELLYSASRVRDVISSELSHTLFFAEPNVVPTSTGKSSSPQATAPTLRWAMFSSGWEQLKRQRNAQPSICQRSRLLMRPAQGDVVRAVKPLPATASSVSPTKKRFGFFTGGHKAGSAEPNLSTTTIAPKTPTTPAGVAPTILKASIGEENRPSPATLVTEVAVQDPGLQNMRKAEQSLWQTHMSMVYSSFSSLPTCAAVSCLELSPSGRLLAVGSVDGDVVVYALNSDDLGAPTAVRAAKATSARRMTRLGFSACGRFLTTYNHDKVASLWSLHSPSSPPLVSVHSSDCFAPELPNSKPKPLHFVAQLVPSELWLEPPIPRDVLERDAPVAAARRQAAPPIAISAVTFFPTLFVTGQPSHLLCAASNGDVLKVAVAHTVKTDTKQPTDPLAHWTRRLVGSTNQAAFEAPSPNDSDLRRAEPFQREFFRDAHRHHTVLFVSAIAPVSTTTRLVSVDQRGGVALWGYDRSYFSGFGWFTPRSTYQLDLSFTSHVESSKAKPTVGDILQIQLTPDKKTLVLMVYASASFMPPTTKATLSSSSAAEGRLRWVQLDLTSDQLAVKRIRMEVDLVGSIPPRFTVISPQKPGSTAPSRANGSFLVLLMNNALQVLSLHTGEPCLPPISLSQNTGTKTSKDLPLLFNSITGSTDLTGAIVALAGEQHRQLRLYRFNGLMPHYSSVNVGTGANRDASAKALQLDS